MKQTSNITGVQTRPATCPCGNDLTHSSAWAVVLPSGELAWDKTSNQPIHHCETCGLAMELKGKELAMLPTDGQIRSWIEADLAGIGVN